MTIWLDGEWIEDGAAAARAHDRGVLLGDGLFETLRHRRGELVRAAAHWDRLKRSCEALGLGKPPARAELEQAITALAGRRGGQDAAIRITLSAGQGPRGLARAASEPICMISAADLMPAPASLSLQTATQRRSASAFSCRHKTLSYIDNVMARREAVAAGAQMALLLDTEGNLSGGDCANLFWISGGAIFTPALDCAVLPGTSRAVLVEALPVEQGRFGADVLADADCVFLTNALIGAVAVTRLDGRSLGIGSGVPDEITALLA